MLALVDCDNFFVSCEKLAEPTLKDHPLVVLSGNDGCIIARCPRVRAMGIAMGTPFFKVRDLLTRHKVFIRSSRHSLYESVSGHVMETLMLFCEHLYIASVDEAFLTPPPLSIPALSDWGREIRQTVIDRVGVPVSVGIAPTATLAKLAGEIAKKETGGMHLLENSEIVRPKLDRLPPENIWGIGPNLARRLRARGIHSARSFADLPSLRVRSIGGSPLLNTWMEINALNTQRRFSRRERKSVQISRTFGRILTEPDAILEAFRTFISQATGKLRRENLVCGRAEIFLESGWRAPPVQIHREISPPTACPRRLTRLIREIPAGACRVRRAGVILSDLSAPEIGDLTFSGTSTEKALGRALERISSRFGPNAVHFGPPPEEKWRPRKAFTHTPDTWPSPPEM